MDLDAEHRPLVRMRGAGQQSGTVEDLGPGQFGQRAESAVVPARTRSRLRAHRCRHGVRQEPRCRLSRDESQRARADAGRRRFRALGIQFDHALSGARLRKGIADLPRNAPKRRAASTAGWTGRFRRCSRSIVRYSGRWCEPRSNSATWPRSRKMPTRKPCNGALSMRSWRRGASSKAMISPSPILRSAPMQGAGSGSKASVSRNSSISSAGSRNSLIEPGFQQFVAPPMS